MLLALLTTLTCGQILEPADPDGDIITNPALMNRFAFFEAFPLSGAGTTTACSTTAPTGARGEVLTFTRTGNGTCTRTATGGLATTGIADGDLVVLSGNVARVEYDSAGVLGLLVESSRTNAMLRSEEIDNAAWTDVASPTSPTLNGACATSPIASPASMPEDYTFAATTGAQTSGRRQGSVSCASTACTASYFVKGVSGSGTLDVCMWGGTATCASCAYTDTSWTRCTVTATIAGTPGVFIGNSSANNGGIARSSNRVCVTAAQAEPGTYATSYIPTVGAAVVRNAESASVSSVVPPHPAFSMASNITLPSGWIATAGSYDLLMTIGSSGSNYTLLGSLTGTGTGCEEFSGSLRRSMSGTLTSGTRVACSSLGASNTLTGFVDNVARTPATTGTMGTPYTTIYLGTFTSGALQPNGIISRICLDPSPSRCR